ncbi:Double zinc ribbon [compost metagenome]
MKFIQRIKDGANRATEKAQHAVEIGRINNQIDAIQQEMDVHFLRMGQVFYEGYRYSDMSIAEVEMTQLSKECDKLQDDVDRLRGIIAELKNERLCECGASAALDANFCPKCGRKLTNDFGSSPAHTPARTNTHSQAAVASEISSILRDSGLSHQEPTQEKAPEQGQEKRKFELPELDEDVYDYAEHDFSPEEKAEFDAEWERRRQEELGAKQMEEEKLARERKRQEVLDERIRYWQENNQADTQEAPRMNTDRELVRCQICTAELPQGSKWCPRCGAEQI